jgi:hypothetical protein
LSLILSDCSREVDYLICLWLFYGYFVYGRNLG